MTLSADGFEEDGKQIIVKGPLSIDLSSLPLRDDITRVDGNSVTYEKRYTEQNTIPITNSEFPGIPRIDYHAMQHGKWSDCLPIEVGHDSEYPNAVFKLAAWKAKSVYREASVLAGLVNNDNIVRLLSIVTVEGRFAGYGMEKLYPTHTPIAPMEERVKEMLPAFLQETVEYLHQTAFVYHCDIRYSNIMVTEQGRLKLIDFDIAQTDVLATPPSAIPDVHFFLRVSERLDHLDISMSILLMFMVLSGIPEDLDREYQIPPNPLEPFKFYLDNNLQRSGYFEDVQNQIQGKLRALMERPDGGLQLLESHGGQGHR
ncbi:serine/threonine protein kinase [Nannizzia gypsea CBS 118893]|uniref:EKC/KEOPS complex subunit BUD32 n=1 Tax=Arthroderma gypseum (strain ATCC MYA-4604 / CBS 118893) TaxID=535722 RepID=E5R0F2_ARTGP|nr:serine/threonine protein kinase [Nannizzia gypsea CBS 118893]EFQ97511.1 serine/threonine protein kinase [Nannizzia gypsea CBS 118893]